MTNNFFQESFQMFTDPSAYTNWMQNFSKFDWASWTKSLQDNNTKAFSQFSPEVLEQFQEMTRNNAAYLQKNIVTYLENVKQNMSASSVDEVVANQYKLVKELSVSHTEHLKDNLQNVLQMTTNLSSETLAKFSQELQTHLNKNAPEGKPCGSKKS